MPWDRDPRTIHRPMRLSYQERLQNDGLQAHGGMVDNIPNLDARHRQASNHGWSGWLGGVPEQGKTDKENGHPATKQVHSSTRGCENEVNSLFEGP
jgi:hypothetical protein